MIIYRFIRRLPIVLSLCRIVAAILFCFYSITQPPQWKKIDIFIILAAAFTDFLDGYIARKLKCTTKLGTYLDPLTDKIFAIIAFLSLSFDNKFQKLLIIAIIIREIYAIFLRTIYFSRKSFSRLKSNIYGKIKTFFEFFLLIFYLLSPLSSEKQTGIIDITLIIIMVLAYYSICQYTLSVIRKKIH
jgi:CDP-diacylglycerol--glycerol-3-phosphate 3-phosphatidyltransferase